VAVLRLAGGAVATLTASCLGPDQQAAGLDVVAPGLGLELTETELVVHEGGRPIACPLASTPARRSTPGSSPSSAAACSQKP
jgi:hypothetical protein